MDCLGNEKRVRDCKANTYGTHDCTDNECVSVVCINVSPNNGKVSLLDTSGDSFTTDNR